jgi:hypothetical protein
MSATIDTWAGRLGLLFGALVVAGWIALAGSPGTSAAPTASIRLGALVNGELELSPVERPILAGVGLRPGGRGETGTLRVRNVTPRALSFALRTTVTQHELDSAAWIEVVDDGAALLRAPLGDTKEWSPKNLHLASGEKRELDVRIWLPEDAPEGWQAARGDAMLELASHPGQIR